MRLILLLGAVFLSGCTPEFRKAQSQVNCLADKLAEVTDEDGHLRRQEIKELDPWGNPLLVVYRKKIGKDVVEVRCVGYDGLPYTHDDLVASRSVVISVEKGLEKNANGLFKGIIKGIREGWKDDRGEGHPAAGAVPQELPRRSDKK